MNGPRGWEPPALRNVVPHQPVLVPEYRPSSCGCMRSNMWGVDLAVGRGCGVRHPGDGAEEISVAIPRVCRPLRRRTSWVATRGRTDVASLAGSAHGGRSVSTPGGGFLEKQCSRASQQRRGVTPCEGVPVAVANTLHPGDHAADLSERLCVRALVRSGRFVAL